MTILVVSQKQWCADRDTDFLTSNRILHS